MRVGPGRYPWTGLVTDMPDVPTVGSEPEIEMTEEQKAMIRSRAADLKGGP